MPGWNDAQKAELTRLWAVHGGKFGKIAKAMGRSKGSISGKSRVMGLQFRGGLARILERDSPAAVTGVSIYPRRVIPPDGNVLKSGDNQRKLGKMITKGQWKGYPVFSLTLQERATCPTTCALWHGCYGNNMGHAKRYEHGPELEKQVWRELASLQRSYPGGFVVRLHLLGDFYSVSYVDMWESALDHFPGLRVFGYSAWKCATPIGRALALLRNRRWDRFAVRTSGAMTGLRAVVFPKVPPAGVIACPAQSGKTSNCSSCALCWATTKAIGFKAH